jgi:hypothetical protein
MPAANSATQQPAAVVTHSSMHLADAIGRLGTRTVPAATSKRIMLQQLLLLVHY